MNHTSVTANNRHSLWIVFTLLALTTFRCNFCLPMKGHDVKSNGSELDQERAIL